MRVLVVCHGNLYRSPFAAACLRNIRPQWHVDSCGMKAKGHGGAAKAAREAATRHGLDLSGHQRRPYTEDLHLEYDIVVYMDGGNHRRLLDAGVPSRKLVNLAAAVGLPRIPDPAFLSGPKQAAVFALISRAVGALPDHLNT